MRERQLHAKQIKINQRSERFRKSRNHSTQKEIIRQCSTLDWCVRRARLGLEKARLTSCAVTLHGADLAHAADIPDLDLGVVGAHSNVVAILNPADRGDVVRFLWCGAELVDVASGSVPEVDGLAKSDGEDVGGRPVEEIEVVVIHELGSVEDLLGSLGDVASGGLLLVVRDLVLRVEHAHVVDVALRRLGRVRLQGQDLGRTLGSQHVVSQRSLVCVLARGTLAGGAGSLGIHVLVESVACHVAVKSAALGDKAVALHLVPTHN